MAYSILQTRRFARQYKKLNDKTAKDVDEAVILICDAPRVGEKKKGDLSSLIVYKFKSHGQQLLLGYSLDDGLRLTYLEAIAPHENFITDIKR
ncbi:ParE-like toxin of type II toxin-antitoxin system [Polynucleobacter meluiroseus]|uniref:ParE-like toxin of type II toxin-antitoxin system n=1 Tax=Polynucleobacter meluiroseus TaxID=1938814 RepID=A0A240E1S1_9BURK|nr:type II toxin-antitoxin system RelE/ParE family toxin [Polynucleobacter meluiroseus]SNX29388.1 ParE-like toxin of type II toxin-antitoxin system [Polynucleobacter meluiroseus]